MRIGDTIYLDYQASTPVDPRVFAEMTPFFTERAGNPHSSEHAMGWQVSAAVEAASAAVAQLVGADPDEVIFTSGATESNNLAIFGLVRGKLAAQGASVDRRHRILVGAIEHKSILALGRVLSYRHDFKVEQVPTTKDGLIDPASLKAMLDDDVFLVSIMAVNNEIGTIQDVQGLASAAHSVGAYFHCDAAQAPCSVDMSTFANFADLISLSGHKMYGPQGVGALVIRREIQGAMSPLILGGGQQNGLRSGTLPVGLCAGMAMAARLLSSAEAEAERADVRRRRDRFIERLRELGFATELNGAHGSSRHPGNANLLFPGFAAQDVIAAVQPTVAISSGSACTSGIPEPSHVLRAIGRTATEAERSIRFSIGRFTTDEDIEEAAAIVAGALSRLEEAELREFV